MRQIMKQVTPKGKGLTEMQEPKARKGNRDGQSDNLPFYYWDSFSCTVTNFTW